MHYNSQNTKQRARSIVEMSISYQQYTDEPQLLYQISGINIAHYSCIEKI
jgi:hypothetical protein